MAPSRPVVSFHFFSTVLPPALGAALFPYTTLFRSRGRSLPGAPDAAGKGVRGRGLQHQRRRGADVVRSEEHTSQLQSHHDVVCRLLLEKKTQRPPRPSSA